MSEDKITTRLMLLEAKNRALEARIATLEGKRPGRKAKPVVVSQEGVCGVDPTRNSKRCPDASLYRRHKGCKGDACVILADKYYDERREAAKAASVQVQVRRGNRKEG